MIDFKKWWPRWGEQHRGFLSQHNTECEPYMVTVAANHVTGDAALFDSEHRHSGYVALRVYSAERQRGLGRDWIHGQRELIEVCMSHAQWAAMISTPNSGNGVPGTLQHILNEKVDQPQVDRRTEKYGGELVAQLQEAVAKIDAMAKGKLTKTQLNDLAMIRQDIVANIPFVAAQFDEHMEVRTEKAKSDIEAHMNAAVQRVGMAALAQSDRLVRLLGDGQ
jgi:hypothetical protein